MLPHLWKLRNRCFRVEGRFAKRLAAKHDVDRIAQNYIQIFRDLVGQRVDQGKTVVHVPFCAEDDLFARVALRGLDVQFQKFVPDVNCVIQQVARCEAFVATRYHALVFALGCGRPVFTVAYASKSQNLLDDIGVPQDAYITNKDLELNDSVQLPEFDSEAAKYFTLGQPERLKLSNDVRAHLNELLLLGE
jgi:polysaccharide pyruvyl transferase WcaK-like protein